jgi:hypothetical protein
MIAALITALVLAYVWICMLYATTARQAGQIAEYREQIARLQQRRSLHATTGRQIAPLARINLN